MRADIEAIAEPDARFADRQGRCVSWWWGSLGAKVLNETVTQALAMMPIEQRPLITHQTGTANLDEVKAAYGCGFGPAKDAEVLPFINNMAKRLADCDVILCRAGAITVSELCSAGVPSILVPLIVSTTDHQRANAEYMAQHGAAVHLPQTDLSPQRLAQEFARLQRKDLLVMARRAWFGVAEIGRGRGRRHRITGETQSKKEASA